MLEDDKGGLTIFLTVWLIYPFYFLWLSIYVEFCVMLWCKQFFYPIAIQHPYTTTSYFLITIIHLSANFDNFIGRMVIVTFG